MGPVLGSELPSLQPKGTAPKAANATEVDLELLLMVDVSRSMSPRELELQRKGYAAALRSDAVWAAIGQGFLGTIALSFVEWAGTQKERVPWRLIETRQDLFDFADLLTVQFDPTLRRTSISEALIFGMRSLEENSFDGLRRVIDVSGDGPNNQGRPVLRARDAVLAKGITINGLPLMTRDGIGGDWHLEELDVYYRTCVTGGQGSFVIPVYSWPDFAEAVKRKLILEIAAIVPPEPLPVVPIQAWSGTKDPTDCRIGEKIWEFYRQRWWEP
ncbi:MAG: DUF1194 domain-containing protein [Pseudomonadota bacterium]